MPSALVIGGSGPTGPFIVDGLLGRGFAVTVLHSGRHEATFGGPVERIHVDPHFAQTLTAGLGNRRWDVVIASYGRLRVTVEALRQMSIRDRGIHPKIKNVMLAAPDIDVDVFRRQIAAGAVQVPPDGQPAAVEVQAKNAGDYIVRTLLPVRVQVDARQDELATLKASIEAARQADSGQPGREAAAALVDWAAFARLRGSWLRRANGSNVAGAAVDSLLFPTIAFGALMPHIVALQFVAKVAGGALWAWLLRGRLLAHA